MTNTPEKETGAILGSHRAQVRRVVFLAFPGLGLLDLSGPMTVFWTASEVCADGLRYERIVASREGGTIATAEGVEIGTVRLADLDPQQIDTIVVPGAFEMEQVLEDLGLIAWLRRAAPDARRVASVCSGAFLLGEAGLLEEKRAVTHWAMCDRLAHRNGSAHVERDAIFIHDGQIWTSAGVTAGIDLALAMVEADCGRAVAMEVARQLVIYLRRPGGQSQFSEILQAQAADAPAFEELHLWLQNNLGRSDLDVAMLAREAKMSERNFARKYKAVTGSTPAKAIERFRVEAARRMLEDSKDNIDVIAARAGFGEEERMRVSFHRHLGVNPRDYRRRFSRP